MEIFTKSARETQKLGERLAIDLRAKVLCLYGELGSGKTTFVQGFARGLGIKKRILSPTFILMREYDNFYHIDLYRVEDEKDVESLGLQEIWSDPVNVVVIEWAEKIKKILPTQRIDVHFEYLGSDQRRINISYINT